MPIVAKNWIPSTVITSLSWGRYFSAVVRISDSRFSLHSSGSTCENRWCWAFKLVLHTSLRLQRDVLVRRQLFMFRSYLVLRSLWMVSPDGGSADMVRDRLFYICRRAVKASYRRAGAFLRRKRLMRRGFSPSYIPRAGCIYFIAPKKFLKLLVCQWYVTPKRKKLLRVVLGDIRLSGRMGKLLYLRRWTASWALKSLKE